jgi:PAS domain S-box-containing protein
MRLGVKAKEALAVTALTMLIVAAATLIHLYQLTGVILQEAIQQASLIQKQIFDQSKQALARGRGKPPREILRGDKNLQRFLEASVGYSANLLYALIADPEGNILLHTESQKVDLEAPARPKLEDLLALGPVQRFYSLYRGSAIYESALPMSLNGSPLWSVRLGLHTSLLRGQLSASLINSLTFAAGALPIAWLITMGLATLTLRPLHEFARQMERLRQGDFEVVTDLGRTDEFRDLAAQLNLLGQQLKSDRLKMLSEKTHFQSVVDHLADGIILINQEHRILFCNKTSEAILGRPIEHIAGRPIGELTDPAHPLRQLIEDTLARQASVRNATLSLPWNGVSKDFLVSAFCMVEGRRGMGVVVLLRDLESMKTLQSLITYSAKLTALGRLTSGVAHEVKNPLNSMAIHLELLKTQLGLSSDEAQRNLDVIESEIRRLDRVVQGFLKFMRPQELRLKSMDVNRLLRKGVALLDAEWSRKSVRFDLLSGPDPLCIIGDEELLDQVFLNLLLNACQAMPDGGTITITATREKEDTVTVRIKDEGCGIRASDRDKIFQLYYTTKADGSGMGLPMAYRMVQLHDGVIEVESEEGKGTTMIIRLPVRQ